MGWLSGCLVTDKDLPCRYDCQCPEQQFCASGVCREGEPPQVNQGDVDGPCSGAGTCSGTLVCVVNSCGDAICRQRCSRVAVVSGCPAGQVCEGFNDATGTEGVCTP